MKKRWLLAAMIALGSCSDPAKSYIAEAEKAVSENLRDPASAEFRNVSYRQANTGAHVVCGEVNGRNGFGGYAGFQQFIWHSGNVMIDTEPGDLVFTRRRLELCI